MSSSDMYPQPGAFLLNCLFYTFCCQVPSEQLEDARFIGNEGPDYWHEYIARDAESRELWSLFDQPAPQPFADQMLFPQSYQEYLVEHDVHQHVWRHRDLFSHLDGMRLGEKGWTSFLTYEECVYLLQHLHTQAEPPLNTTIDRCVHSGRWEKEWPVPASLIQHIQEEVLHEPLNWKEEENTQFTDIMYYWGYHYTDELLTIWKLVYECWMQEYPEEMHVLAQEYYQNIWQLEAKVVERIRYAVSRGWGILMPVC